MKGLNKDTRNNALSTMGAKVKDLSIEIDK